MDCLEFAFDNANKEGWFKGTIANSYDNNGQQRRETVDLYAANILDNNRWGDPDVEGRILCEKYGVKLHVVENNPLKAIDNQQDPFLHQLIDHRGSKSAGEHNKVDYNDSSVLHIINKGGAHFEPSQEQNDYHFAMKLQGQEYNDYRAQASQEKSDRSLAEKLQAQEISSFMQSAFREHSDRLLAARLRREEFAKYRQGQKSFSPRCNIEKLRLTHQTPQLVK